MNAPASYEIEDFQRQVLDASRDKPVLVDFWAEWCGPCKTLGPVLEKLAGETADWNFVKVDVDANQELAGRYQIRSIPAVKLFVNGAVADEFTGALPEGQIREWLDRTLPNEIDTLVAEAQETARSGDTATARSRLEQALAAAPDHAGARVALAQSLLGDDAARAVELVAAIGMESPHYERAQNIQVTADALASTAAAPDSPARVDYLLGVEAMATGAVEKALSHLIDSVICDKGYLDEAARKLCVALFDQLADPDLARQYRRRLQTALH